MSDLPVMKFKIKEKVKLSNEEQSFNELSSLEIEPVIKVRDLEKQVEVEGYLVLYGEFNIRNQYLEKNLDQFDALHFDSALNNYKIDSFQHRIPLSIKIDSKRVKDLSQIIVEVENFDYQIISNQEIEISSELKLLGINQANMVEEKISKEKNKSDFTNDIEHKSIKNIEVDKEIKKIIQEEKKEDYFKNKNDSEYPMYPLIKNIENQDINKKDITDDEGSYPDIFANNDNEENETLETKSKSKDMDETEEDNRGSENGTKTMLYGLLSGNENSQYKIKMYFVQKEDSIDEIANKYEVNSIDVISLNKLEDNNIKVGQILYLPIKKIARMFNNMEIVEIIRQYDLRVGMIETYSSFYRLKTNLGTKLLTKWSDINILKETYRYRELVVKAGFRKINRFIRTKDGLPYVIHNNVGYALTDDIKGKIISINDEKELKMMVNSISKFQQALFNIKLDNQLKMWSSNYYNGLKYIRNVEENLKLKKIRNEMDELLISDIQFHRKQIAQSVELANKVEKIANKNNSLPKLNHGNFQLSSFILDEFDECWINDFLNPVIDVAAYDIAKFIRRLYKGEKVQIEKIYKILDYYQEDIPLKYEDKLWILTYLAYPHDLWKFIRIYYSSKSIESKCIIDQYRDICEQQMNIGQLYQGLYNYFSI